MDKEIDCGRVLPRFKPLQKTRRKLPLLLGFGKGLSAPVEKETPLLPSGGH